MLTIFRPRLALPQVAESSSHRDGGEWTEVALNPMIRFVTLLAVADMLEATPGSIEVGGGVSSIGDTHAPETADPLFFPKLSFHLEGFLVTGAGVIVGDGCTGGTVLKFVDELEKDIEIMVKTYLREEDLEALLISRASDCDASASVARVSSSGTVDEVIPLPFLVPRFLRLVVEVEREVIPSTSTSAVSRVICSTCSSMS